ncbi:MAG: formate/nitrite transporter family protein [Clostridia bacterium]|nr:formate/nitrite transporter family protein [Clostridia bacterium]
MDKENILKMIEASKAKVNILNKSIGRYFLLSMMAGIYVGLGIVLIFSIGAPFKAIGAPGLKALMGASFALALTLVIFTGSELFTGNNMTMMIGSLSRQVSWLDTSRVWVVSFIGNLAGSLLLALTMAGTGLIVKSPLKDFILTASADKMNAPFEQLFFRGILCNMLVCLAIWTASRAKEDTAKLILIFWCLFGFIGAGFEHSVANMTLLGMSLLIPHDPSMVSWAGFAANLIPVTLGNIVGGAICIAAAYWYISTIKQ